MASLLRVAVVGCGAISGNHIRAIQSAEQRICALCDIDVAQAQKKAEKFDLGDVSIYDDYETMLDRERPDAVHICTPHDLHAPMIITALSRNIHVLCEKPLCITLDQLGDISAAAERSHAQLGVCHQNRYEPRMIHLKRLAEEGVRAGFGSVVWNRDAAYYRTGAWRGTVEHEGGGVLINQALHTLDLMQWICGFPTHVIAHTHNDLLKNEIEVEDTVSANYFCENGVRFQFYATNTATADLPVQIQVKLSNGDRVDAQNQQLFHTKRDGTVQTPSENFGKSVWGNGHKALIKDFYECVQSGNPFPIDAEEAGKVIRMILATYASCGKKMAISVS